MTSAAALITRLQRRGVTLEPRGHKLAVRPTSLVTSDELEELRRQKAEVLRLLAPKSRRDLIAEYETVLGNLWLLNVPCESRDPRAHQADLNDAQRLLAEQVRQVYDTGPELAAAISRTAARAWANLMKRCPWCGMDGPLHEPEYG